MNIEKFKLEMDVLSLCNDINFLRFDNSNEKINKLCNKVLILKKKLEEL